MKDKKIILAGDSKNRWVVPTKILETGFQFKHPLLEDSLSDIISKVPRKHYHLF